MSKTKIPPEQRARIAELSRYRCGYCQTQELVIGMPLVVDHIIPEARGGGSEDSNLWLACRRCNEFKGVQTSAVDPETGESMELFNPRTQIWSAHFTWTEDGTQIAGKTATGRVTVEILKLNNAYVVRSRRRWVSIGWHPPKD